MNEFRGLYRYVKISVRTLDIIIVSCIVVIVVLLALNLRNPGFTVTFDSRGGTDVPSQKQMYGELLEVPADPDREGYEFTGWFTDASGGTQISEWDTSEDTIQGEVNLYAGWEEKLE